MSGMQRQLANVLDQKCKANQLMQEKFKILRCPSCKGSINFSETFGECVDCKKRFDMQGDIPDLRLGRHDYYFNPVPRDRMRKLISEIESCEWEDTVDRFLKEVKYNKDWVDNMIAAGRYSWKLFLDLPKDAVALDLGCGLGNLSQSLAPHVAELYAMDLTIERLEFSEKRLKRFVPDSEVCLLAGGDGKFLPFADASLDIVCICGVLEWVPDVDEFWQSAGSKLERLLRMIFVNIGDTNPRRMQIRFLREVNRILKPDGQIFVAIENRHNYQYFGGRPDHHSGLRFGALMPRWLANMYSIWRNKRPYRTYTHGKAGYRQLMSLAGYSDSDFIGLYPGYSHLRELRPFGFERYCEERATAQSFAGKFTRSKRTAPAYGIVGRKGERGRKKATRFIDRIIRDMSACGDIAIDKYCISQISVSAKEKTVLKLEADGLVIAIRLPWDSYATRQEEVNHRWISYFRSRDLKTVRLPLPVAKGSIQGVNYFSEYWVEGATSRERLERRKLEDTFSCAITVINELRSHGEKLEVAYKDSAVNASVEIQLGKIEESFGKDMTQLISAAVSKLAKGQTVSTGIRHGDYSASNLLQTNSPGLPALIDWEFGEERGIMGLDEFAFFDSVGRRLGYFDSVIGCLKEIHNGMQSEIGRAFKGCIQQSAHKQHSHSGITEENFVFLGTLYWLDHIAKQLYGSARLDQKWIEANVSKFIEILD